ncbi:MAG: DUF4340 domain-containing protein [Planctomycetes bacterium]|nr:DUF4340 domain-containing protein [Planctomycetota bacterium]
MNFKTTVILAIVALLIGGVILITDSYNGTEPDAASRFKGVKLFDVRTEKITRLKMETDGKMFLCEKHGFDWKVTAPFEVRADESEIRTIASRFEFGVIRGSIPENEIKNLSDYGLDKPRVTATAWAGPDVLTVNLGFETALKDGVYAMTPAHKDVLIVDRDLLDVFSTGLSKLRDKHLFKYDAKKVDGLQLDYKDVKMSFVKQQGAWLMELPVKDAAHTGKIETVVDSGVDLKILEFVEDNSKDLSKYGLTAPERRMAVRQAGEDEYQELLLGNYLDSGKKQYACMAGSASVVIVKAEDYFGIFQSTYEFRSRKFFNFSPENVQEIKLYLDGVLSVDVSKIEGGESKFYMLSPQNLSVEPYSVEGFLGKLAGIEIVNFISEDETAAPGYGLDPAPVKLTITLKTGIETSYCFAPADKCTFARQEGNAKIISLQKELFSAFQRGIYIFRSRVVYALDTRAAVVDYVLIEKPGFKTEVILQDGKWKFAGSDGAEVNEYAVKNILTTTAEFLLADDFVLRDGKTDADFGFDRPTCKFSYKASENGVEIGRTLIIGKNANDKQYYARLADSPDIFLVPVYLSENIINTELKRTN